MIKIQATVCWVSILPPNHFFPSWFIISATIEINFCFRVFFGISRSKVNYTIHGGGTKQCGRGTFDHFNLFAIFNWKKRPLYIASIGGKHRHFIHHHQNTTTGSVTKSTSPTNICLSINHVHSRYLINCSLDCLNTFIFNERGL